MNIPVSGIGKNILRSLAIARTRGNHSGEFRGNVARCYESVSLRIQLRVPRIPQWRVNWSVGIASIMEVVKAVFGDSHQRSPATPQKFGSGEWRPPEEIAKEPHLRQSVSLKRMFWLVVLFGKFLVPVPLSFN